MKFKDLLGKKKEPAVKADAKTEIKPKVKIKPAKKKAKSKKRF